MKEKYLLILLIIQPIEKIIEGLKNGEFWDRDLPYLKKQLKNYSQLAIKIIGEKTDIEEINIKILNDHNKKILIKYFENLLKFYRSII